MKKIIFFLTFFVITEIKAHQPVLNDLNPISHKEPYLIEKPEVSKAIYSTLKGKPHFYKIISDKIFKFYVGITVPKIEECSNFKKFSFQILDKKKKLIKELDGKNFKWWPWYEKYGKKDLNLDLILKVFNLLNLVNIILKFLMKKMKEITFWLLVILKNLVRW